MTGCGSFARPARVRPAVRILFAEALRQYAANHLAEAERLCRQVLALDPNHADGLHLLGTIAFQMGRHDAAIELATRAVALRDDVASWHVTLGNALQAGEQLEAAVARYERALVLQPNLAVAHNNLGQALRKLRRLDEAVSHFGHALALEPNAAEVHANLAGALKEQGRLAEAVAHYTRALALKPGVAALHNNLGNALKEMGDLAAAAEQYRRALALQPDVAGSHANLARVLQDQGRTDEAVAQYRQSLALQPEAPDVHAGLGNALRDLGDATAAERAYHAAIARAPGNPLYYRHLLDTRRVTATDRHPGGGRGASPRHALTVCRRSDGAAFCAGQGVCDLSRYNDSFRHFLAGNALKRRTIHYDEADALGVFDRIRDVFAPRLMADRHGAGDTSAVPVFIVGMPRSGTSLAEQILASHKLAFGAGELRAFQRAVASAAAADASLPYPELVPGLSDKALQRIGSSYVAELTAPAPDAARVVDKMPGNFIFVGLIHLALPNARIIHMRRDPLDTCVSCFTLLFGSGMPFTYDLCELGRYYRGYERLMRHWRQVLPAGVMLDVQYEDVVADVAGQARRIVAHCGLPWDDTCLAFHRTRRSVRTASALQVRRPVYGSSIGRWRVYGDRLRPLIEELRAAEFDPTPADDA